MKGFTLTQMLMPPIVCIAVVAVLAQRRDDRQSESVEKVHRLCLGAKLAMEDDARAFESGDAKKQEEALDRFYEGHDLYHSASSILYCIDSKDLPTMPARCEIEKDYKCLADLARQIAGKL